MMLFYPPILPNGLALCWLQNFRKLNQGIVTILDYLYKADLYKDYLYKVAKCYLDLGLVFIFLSCKPITSTF